MSLLRNLLAAGVLTAAVWPRPAIGGTNATPPGIRIPFTLDKPGYVTLVIEDAQGRRVRNLIAEEKFAAGEHVVSWDGAEGGDVQMHKTGTRLVGPGVYSVRGLVRDELKLIYEIPVYNPGTPPWGVRDAETGLYVGRWLSDHSSPSGALFLPGGSPAGTQPELMFSAQSAEWGDGFMWTDCSGHKLHGQRWAGGTGTGGWMLTRDMGTRGVEGVYAYSVSQAGGGRKKRVDKSVRVTAFVRGTTACEFRDIPVTEEDVPLQHAPDDWMGIWGLAAYDGRVLVSTTYDNELLLIDATRVPPRDAHKGVRGWLGASALGNVVGHLAVERPRGLVFNAAGDLFAISGAKVLRFSGAGASIRDQRLTTPQVFVPDGLSAPRGLALDRDGNLYVSDWGASHQIKVFSPDGKPLRIIGRPGGAQLGAYDEQRMANPLGMAITDAGDLWVAEYSVAPRRMSRWKTNGEFVAGFYGPPSYGGGGVVGPDARSVFYVHPNPWDGEALLEFGLDWSKGVGTLKNLLCYCDVAVDPPERLPGPGPGFAWDAKGRRYLSNAYHTHAQFGAQAFGIWIQRGDRAVPAAAIGYPTSWKPVLGRAEFKGHLPEGVNLEDRWDGGQPFVWSDLNGDGKVQVDEVKWYKPPMVPGEKRPHTNVGRFTLGPDFAIIAGSGMCFEPVGFTALGAPIYDLDQHREVFEPDTKQESDSYLPTGDGFIVAFGSPLRGYRDGKVVWTYPNDFRGVQGSHGAPKPRGGGDIIGGTRVLGPTVRPKGGEAGEVWALNSNMGVIHLGTSDGLYIGKVMRDSRVAGGWPVTVKRGDNVIEYTNGQESFAPSLRQAADGRLYMCVGGEFIGICRLEGLDTVRRMGPWRVAVTAQDLQTAADRQTRDAATVAAPQAPGRIVMSPARRDVTADVAAWTNADWVTIEKLKSWTKEFVTQKAALAVFGDRLHVIWTVRQKDKLLANSAENPVMLFKTGAGLDVMLGTSAAADPGRKEPAAGDLRLLVTRNAKNKTVAVLYRQKAGAGGTPQVFSSPWRSVSFDDVREVSDQVELKEVPYLKSSPEDMRVYELAVPLAVLGLQPRPGIIIKGDIGYLRGKPGMTNERVYWHNKATGLTADIPGEAMLEPHLWGTFEFVP